MKQSLIKGLFVLAGLFSLSAPTFMVCAAQPAQLLVRTPVLAPKVTFDEATRTWLSDKPIVRVAFWSGARPPLHMGFEPDVFEGITADVLGLVQQATGLQLQLIRFDSRALALDAITRGEVEMLALNDVTETDSQVSGTAPYLLNRRVIIRRTDESFMAKPDLAGERLAYVERSEAVIEQLKRQYPETSLVRYTNHLNALAGLAYDQTDAFITNAITAEFLISRYYRNEVHIASDAAAPNVADINFGVSKLQPHLLTAVNQTLASVPIAGMLRITSRWGLSNNFVIPRASLDLSSEQMAWIAAHPEIRVLVAGTYAPLTFFDEDGRLQGLSADLLKLIERRTGLEFKVVRGDGVVDMVEKLQGQHADLIAALTIGDFRLEPNQYTRPYMVSPFVVVTRRNESDIRSLAELTGKKIALPWGNPLTAWANTQYPGITKISVENATRGLEMLVAGEVDASVHTQFGADYFIKHHFQQDLHIASVIGPTPARLAMAVSPDNQVLKDIINKVLLEIAPEELKEMTDRWRNHPAPAVANSWNNYKGVVFGVVAGACFFVVVFLVWNYILRTQISERKKAERALEDQLNFSRTLIDGSPVALFVRDAVGRLIHCNREYLDFLRTASEDVLGKTLIESDHLGPLMSAQYHQHYMDSLRHGQPSFEDVDVQINEKNFRIYHWILPFQNSEGHYAGLIGGWLDISERAELMEQLHQAKENAIDASRSKSVFLASMSHEIRTPISALIGLIEMLRLREGNQALLEQNLEVAHQSAQSLLSLIGDILDLSKIEAGAMVPSPRPTDLMDLTQSLYQLFETNAVRKKLDYRLITDVEHRGVLIDGLMLHQIVSNLLSNAIKFTEQGRIQVLLRELPNAQLEGHGRFLIEVQDTGRGLTEVQQKEVFEPFVQADTQRRDFGGTGLGLSICRRLAELLGAHLTVESRPGSGSSFAVIFEAPLAEVTKTEVLVEHLTPPHTALKVLVVEDHAPNRLLLCQQLEYLGHKVVPCEDGATAFAVWQQAEPPFDLTITDCSMPGMDGFELTRRIRANEADSMLTHPIFGLTANAQVNAIDQCIDSGMTRCLFKPVSVGSLETIINEIVPFRRQTNEVVANVAVSELQQIKMLNLEAYESLVDEIIKVHREDAAQLEKLLLLNDFGGLANLAHKIRGGAHLTGDQQLIESCRALEAVASQESKEGCKNHVELLLAGLEALEQRLWIDRR